MRQLFYATLFILAILWWAFMNGEVRDEVD